MPTAVFQYRRAGARLALPAFVALAAAFAAAAPSLEAQRSSTNASQSSVTITPLESTALPQPRASKRPALAGKVDLSLNMFTWLDEQGLATVAPADRAVLLAILREGILVVTGSQQERLAAAGPNAEAMAVVQPIQMMHTTVDANTMAHARRIIDARIGDRYQYVAGRPMIAGRLQQGQSSSPESLGSVLGEPSSQQNSGPRQPGAVEGAVRQAGSSVGNGVLWGITGAAQATIMNAVNRAIYRY